MVVISDEGPTVVLRGLGMVDVAAVNRCRDPSERRSSAYGRRRNGIMQWNPDVAVAVPARTRDSLQAGCGGDANNLRNSRGVSAKGGL